MEPAWLFILFCLPKADAGFIHKIINQYVAIHIIDRSIIYQHVSYPITFVEVNAAWRDKDKMGEASFIIVITGSPYDTGATMAYISSAFKNSV